MSADEHQFGGIVAPGVVRCLRCGRDICGVFPALRMGERFWVQWSGDGKRAYYPGPLGFYPVDITITACRRSRKGDA